MLNLTSKIIAFETEEVSASFVIRLFAELVQSGLAWSLQGSYGRTAAGLIDAGYIDHEGNILVDLPDEEE